MKRNVKDCIFVWIPFGVVLGSVILVLLLRWVPVRYSTLMLKRAFLFRGMESYHAEQEWVSLEDVSPELIEAVLAAEDSRFYHHHGFDWVEIQEARKSYRADDAPLRGCSTITQQTAKTYLRSAHIRGPGNQRRHGGLYLRRRYGVKSAFSRPI